MNFRLMPYLVMRGHIYLLMLRTGSVRCAGPEPILLGGCGMNTVMAARRGRGHLMVAVGMAPVTDGKMDD